MPEDVVIEGCLSTTWGSSMASFPLHTKVLEYLLWIRFKAKNIALVQRIKITKQYLVRAR